MPRVPRVVAAGIPIHITQRGNNRSAIFRAPGDYRLYAALLRQASQRFECAIHAYALMTNHIHLLMTPNDKHGPARMMQVVGTRYVPGFNQRYNRTGTLWEGRYRSTTIDSESYLLACSRYIELNPVRAMIVSHPSQYRWSSYRHNADGAADALVTPHAIYRALNDSAEMRREEYRALFTSPLEADASDAIRGATKRDLVLGDERFCDNLAATLKRPVTRLCHGGDRRSNTLSARRTNT